MSMGVIKHKQLHLLHSLQLLLLDCVHFNCCSLIVSASAPAAWLCLLQLLLPDGVCLFSCSAPWLCPLQFLLPDCICFSSYSQTAPHTEQSIASTKVLHHQSSPAPPKHPTSVTHTHMHTQRNLNIKVMCINHCFNGSSVIKFIQSHKRCHAIFLQQSAWERA